MVELQRLRLLYTTVWAEAVREIVSAEDSEVKFIITDHPVTTFNAAWDGQDGQVGDAPVMLVGTQTIFALDCNHCLILTHLPYAQSPDSVSLTSKRPNARNFDQALIRTDAFIRSRRLGADEVVAINQLLKVRAQRYIAAAEPEWLMPERRARESASDFAKVLLPPRSELWHFGGDIFIGYADGKVDYRDAFGRSSAAHRNLVKPQPSVPPEMSDICPCGSGETFQDCCHQAPEWSRPPWNVLSIRERNLGLIRAVTGILRIDSGRSWQEIQRELSEDDVARIHRVVHSLWPEDTDFAALLPRPHNRVARAVFMGASDPRTVGMSVISLAPLFDQLLVIDPFQHPGNVRPEFSPVESPGQYKAQLLKNVLFLFALEPLIRAKKVILFPDPSGFVPGYRRAMFQMAEERMRGRTVEDRDFGVLALLAEDEAKRMMLQGSDEQLGAIYKQMFPSEDEANLAEFIAYVRQKQSSDPFVLQQAATPQIAKMTCSNLETTLFVAQMTGAAVVTDIPELWAQLHAHTRAEINCGNCQAFNSEVSGLSVSVLPEIALRAADTKESTEFRTTLREIFSIANDRNFSELRNVFENLKERFERIPLPYSDELKAHTYQASLAVSIPATGFESPVVQSLIISFGREDAPTSVSIAFFRSTLEPQSSGSNVRTS